MTWNRAEIGSTSDMTVTPESVSAASRDTGRTGCYGLSLSSDRHGEPIRNGAVRGTGIEGRSRRRRTVVPAHDDCGRILRGLRLRRDRSDDRSERYSSNGRIRRALSRNGHVYGEISVAPSLRRHPSAAEIRNTPTERRPASDSVLRVRAGRLVDPVHDRVALARPVRHRGGARGVRAVVVEQLVRERLRLVEVPDRPQ